MTKTPLEHYKDRIAQELLKPDPEQEKAVAVLQDLYDGILKYEAAPKLTLFQKLTGKGGDANPPPRGVYMYGGVGRGKSMLMDLFFSSLPETIAKRRVHFHEFMIEVHDYIHSRRSMSGDKGMVDQALPSLAEIIARRARILCFDEFHVTDITDAMILGRLFKILFEHDVVVVATSNWAPDSLYDGGLQRDRFLPFISLLKEKVHVLHLDSPNDYRAQTVQIEGTYFHPLGKAASQNADKVFAALTHGEIPHKDVIVVKGRDIVIQKVAKGCARFTFNQLCEQPLGAEDYLSIARKYHTVFLEGVPKMGYDRRNEAKRLMNLIDALYEARARVIITAATTPDRLYSGHEHSYEFERTISRLLEMQSEGYP